ncbi:hypothetical protein AAFN75_02505 [Algibacter sp. AS12]|uniref:hypothetical protein n=1 Tax=Algibacter sp. AS12 TaxID=3135773 RepID=UPI00398B6D0A
MNKFFLGCFLAFSFFSCSSDDGNDSGVKNEILTGTVEGKPFTFVGGKAFDTSFNNETLLSVNLTNERADCSSTIFDYGLSISVDVPKAVGTYNDVNIVTKDNDSQDPPFNSIGQTVEITAISATEISGKMKLNREASTIAEASIFEGTFTVPVCE